MIVKCFLVRLLFIIYIVFCFGSCCLDTGDFVYSKNINESKNSRYYIGSYKYNDIKLTIADENYEISEAWIEKTHIRSNIFGSTKPDKGYTFLISIKNITNGLENKKSDIINFYYFEKYGNIGYRNVGQGLINLKTNEIPSEINLINKSNERAIIFNLLK